MGQPMSIVELLGWVAVLLLLTAYWQRTMVPLRVSAMLANVFFIAWSVNAEIMQTLVLHSVLLPFNAYRLYEILNMERDAKRAARGDGEPMDWLKPYVTPIDLADGEHVFRKGDTVDYLYYLDKGKVVFDEVGKSVSGGNIFGEVAFFTHERVRTASARCEGPCRIMRINERDMVRVFLQNPAFNMYIVRLLAKRILAEGESPIELIRAHPIYAEATTPPRSDPPSPA